MIIHTGSFILTAISWIAVLAASLAVCTGLSYIACSIISRLCCIHKKHYEFYTSQPDYQFVMDQNVANDLTPKDSFATES